MSQRSLTVVLALSVGLNIGLLVNRVGRPERPPRPPGSYEAMLNAHLDRMSRSLSLSPEQRSAIEDVLDEEVPRILELRETLDAERRTLADLYNEDDLDQDVFGEQIERLNETQAELERRVGEVMTAEAVAMTADQRRKYFREMPWRPKGPPPPPRRR